MLSSYNLKVFLWLGLNIESNVDLGPDGRQIQEFDFSCPFDSRILSRKYLIINRTKGPSPFLRDCRRSDVTLLEKQISFSRCKRLQRQPGLKHSLEAQRKEVSCKRMLYRSRYHSQKRPMTATQFAQLGIVDDHI